MKNIIKVVAVVLICVGLIAGGVWALTTYKTVPVSMTIIPGSAPTVPVTTSITVYSDAGATTEIINLMMGELAQGANTTVNLWAKNTGNVAVNIQGVADNVTWGSIGVVPGTVEALAVGVVRQYAVTFSVSANATTGAQSFNLRFIEP